MKKLKNKKMLMTMLGGVVASASIVGITTSTSCGNSSSGKDVTYELSSTPSINHGATLTITASHGDKLAEGSNFEWAGFTDGQTTNGITFSLSEADDKSILTVTNNNNTDEDKIFNNITVSYLNHKTNIQGLTCKISPTVIEPTYQGPKSVTYGIQLEIDVSSNHANQKSFDWELPASNANYTFVLAESGEDYHHNILNIQNHNSTANDITLSNLKVSCNGTQITLDTITIVKQATDIVLGYSIADDVTDNITVASDGGILTITAESEHFIGNCVWNTPEDANGITYQETGDNNEILIITNNNTGAQFTVAPHTINVSNNGTTTYVEKTITYAQVWVGATLTAGGVKYDVVGDNAAFAGVLCTNTDTYSFTKNIAGDTSAQDVPRSSVTSIKFKESDTSSLVSIGDNFLRSAGSLNCDITIPTSCLSIGTYFLSGCGNFNGTVTLHSGITAIGDSFMSSCTSFSHPIAIPGIQQIKQSFMSSCTSFNSSITFAETGTESIAVNFLSGCSDFNQVLSLPDTITTINDGFLSNCTSFNNGASESPLILPTSLTTIRAGFLYYCTSFNQNIDIPSTVTQIISDQSGSKKGFLTNCNSMTSTVNFGNKGPSIFTGSYPETHMSTTTSNAVPCVTTGITVKGTQADQIHATLVDSVLSPWRTLHTVLLPAVKITVYGAGALTEDWSLESGESGSFQLYGKENNGAGLDNPQWTIDNDHNGFTIDNNGLLSWNAFVGVTTNGSLIITCTQSGMPSDTVTLSYKCQTTSVDHTLVSGLRNPVVAAGSQQTFNYLEQGFGVTGATWTITDGVLPEFYTIEGDGSTTGVLTMVSVLAPANYAITIHCVDTNSASSGAQPRDITVVITVI